MRNDLSQEMVTKQLRVVLCDSPDDAPKYTPDWTMLRIETAIVVGKGTVSGKPTVDLQMIDADGKQFVVLATGGIMQMLVAAVNGKGGG